MSEDNNKRPLIVSGIFLFVRAKTGKLSQESRKWKISVGILAISAIIIVSSLITLAFRSDSGWGVQVTIGTVIIGIVVWIGNILTKYKWKKETVFFTVPLLLIILLIFLIGSVGLPYVYVAAAALDMIHWPVLVGGGLIIVLAIFLNEKMGEGLENEKRSLRVLFQFTQLIAVLTLYIVYISIMSAPIGVLSTIDFLFVILTFIIGIILWTSRSMVRWEIKNISIKVRTRHIWFIVFCLAIGAIAYPLIVNILPPEIIVYNSNRLDIQPSHILTFFIYTWSTIVGGGLVITSIGLLFYEGYPLLKDRGPPGIVTIAGFVIVLAILYMTFIAYWITPFDPFYINSGHTLEPPSPTYPLGTTQLGQDMLSRVLAGGATMFQVAILSVIVCFTVGVPIGLYAPYKGGFTDRSVGLVMDSIFAFPGLVLAIAITAMLGPGVVNMAVSIAVVYVPSYFRVVRSQVLTIRELPYVEAAIVMGAKDRDIIFRYILPNVLPSAIVLMSINFADAILTAAGLTFIGLGPPVEIPDWGWDLTFGFDNMVVGYWWEATFPGLMIVFLALGFTFAGEGLNEILTPKLQE